MSYRFDEYTEDPEPQPSGRRSGGPPPNATAIDLLDQPDSPQQPRVSNSRFQKIVAVALMALVIAGLIVMLINLVWPR